MVKTENVKYRALLKKLNLVPWFDKNAMDLITKIKYTPLSVTNDEWKQMYEKYGKHKSVLQMLSLTKEIPYDIIRDISIKNKEPDVDFALLDREDLEKSEIKTIFDKIGYDYVNQLMKIAMSRGEAPFSQNVIDTIINDFPELKNNALAFSKDRKMIEKILNEFSDDEEITNAIANNVSMPESIRDKAFDFGAEWTEIAVKTTYMKRLLYSQLSETIFEFKPKDDKEYRAIETAVAELLSKIRNNEIPESCQLDLLYKVKSLPKPTRREIMLLLAENTKHKSVMLTLMEQGSSEIKKRCLTNEHITDEVFHKRMDQLLKETKSLSDSSSDYWSNISEIESIIKLSELKDTHYRKLIDFDAISIINALASSAKTPANILDIIIKNDMGYGTDPDTARINIELKSGGMGKYLENVNEFIIMLKRHGEINKLSFEEIDKKYSHTFPHITNKKEIDFLCDKLEYLEGEIKDTDLQKALDYYERIIQDVTRVGCEMAKCDKVFVEKETRFGLVDVDIARTGSYEEIKEQLSKLDEKSLEKVRNIIVGRVKIYIGEILNGGEPNDFVELYLGIDGYADMYAACNEIQLDRRTAELMKEYGDDEEER